MKNEINNKNFNWFSFLRLSLGVSLSGIGIAIGTTYSNKLSYIIVGFIFLGVGLATIFSD